MCAQRHLCEAPYNTAGGPWSTKLRAWEALEFLDALSCHLSIILSILHTNRDKKAIKI